MKVDLDPSGPTKKMFIFPQNEIESYELANFTPNESLLRCKVEWNRQNNLLYLVLERIPK